MELVVCSAPEGCERLASSQENTRNAQNTPLHDCGDNDDLRKFF